jgi:hypothetical protein
MKTWKQDAIDLLEEARGPLELGELHKRLARRRTVSTDEVKKHRNAVYEGLRTGPCTRLSDGKWVHNDHKDRKPPTAT